MHRLPESSCVVLNAKQYCAGTVDQHATEIDVAALADAEQPAAVVELARSPQDINAITGS